MGSTVQPGTVARSRPMSSPHQNPKRRIRFIHTVISVMETSNFKRARSELVGNVRKSFDHDPVGRRGAEGGLEELLGRSVYQRRPPVRVPNSQ